MCSCVLSGHKAIQPSDACFCRLNEDCSIQLFERGPFVSFANCGLPYFVGNVIEVRQ